MEDKWEKYQEAYYEKQRKQETWSGFPVKEIYTPEDTLSIEYKRDIADAGKFPYTRGIHSDMFRGRYWTRREVTGLGSPLDTNKRAKYLIEKGTTGLDTIADITYEMGLDADHPWAQDEVGLSGVNITSIEDMERLIDGIPIDKVSWSLITASCSALVTMAQYIAAAERRGIDPSVLKGSIQNDPIHFRYCGFKPATPLDLALKCGADLMEYCAFNLPKWYFTTVNMYDLREQGITAPQELAFGFGIAGCYIDELIGRGLRIDEFAPRFTFYVSSQIDFLEEIAKFRAARRMWAKLMKEKYGAKDPRSMKFKFAVHTAGCSLVPQQPLNNVIRVAYEALAAVLGGVQSLHCCSYDEPIALPTEEAHSLAVRTQQIIAYETGVASVSDPLGGSYYLENLTNKIEEEADKIMKEVDERGGMYEAIKTEWLDREMEKEALKVQKEIDKKERIIVGVNDFVSGAEEKTPFGVQRIPLESAKGQVEDVIRLKKTRNIQKLRESIKKLRKKAEARENLMPSVIEAVKAYATTGEIMGTIREASGYSYDPMGVIESPFKD